MTWRRYDPREMHHLLCNRLLSGLYWKRAATGEIGAQALSCPYYVPLEGWLGSDWGVIVNPESSRFGWLTFEHDDCGCPPGPEEDADGWGRHRGCPEQDGDMWSTAWVHVCVDGWCDPPCEQAAQWGTPI